MDRITLIPTGAVRPREMMSGNHIGPVEAVDVFQKLGAQNALAVHWGTFKLSSEAINDPPDLLRRTLAEHRIAPDRFRGIDVGVNWEVLALN